MAASDGGGGGGGFPVIVHVYDLSDSNQYLHCVGLGFYHTGVEVQGREYTFSAEGVMAHTPRAVPRFRQSILLGHLEPGQETSAAIRALRAEFRPGEYHVLANNCNDFSDALCRAVLGRGLPGWINRMANCAGCLSARKMPLAGVVPGATPPPSSSSSASSASFSSAAAAAAAAPLSTQRKKLTPGQEELLRKLERTRAALKRDKSKHKAR